LWHIGGGLSLPIAGLLVPEHIFLPALISITVAFLIFEIVRLKVPGVNKPFLHCFRKLLREGEAATLTSSAYLLIAASIVFVFYDQSIAAIALTFLAVGDPVAGMAREKWGESPNQSSHKIIVKGKGLRGSGACLLACLVAGAILASITQVAFWLVVIGAICATAVEFFSLPLNDNLTIPLVAGGVMMLIWLLCG
jgi:dolichol kinase